MVMLCNLQKKGRTCEERRLKDHQVLKCYDKTELIISLRALFSF